MIRRRLFDVRGRTGPRGWLTVLAVTIPFGLTACATDFAVANQDATFTADGHPRVGATRNGCDGAGGSRQIARTELYFGTSRADGTHITEDQYRQFMDEEVLSRFGDSLLLSARRQFADENGKIVREPAEMLILFYTYGDHNYAAVKEVMNAFTRTFPHETLQRVDSRACVAF
jgi:Protein of unknown function (DUF3574)